jgi:RES domain-containing protein
MTVSVWRIASDAPGFSAEQLNGTGARLSGGRWNRKGKALVYASESIALACLETLVHLNVCGLPLNRYLVRIDIPDAIWDQAECLDADALPVGWDATPAGKVSLDLGDRWLTEQRSSVLVVASAIIPQEFNVLINPAHPDSAALIATKTSKWLYDPRLL